MLSWRNSFISIFIFNITGHDPQAIFIDTNNQVSILMLYFYYIFLYSNESKCIKCKFIDSGDTGIVIRYYDIIININSMVLPTEQHIIDKVGKFLNSPQSQLY